MRMKEIDKSEQTFVSLRVTVLPTVVGAQQLETLPEGLKNWLKIQEIRGGIKRIETIGFKNLFE